ncbi:MAG: TRAP transporter substrate-binding protein DctP [Woeseiaceae bacterium]|nr:TRAP transporter substrate-binding protein DctP [Gammaproteobacteria bacterium]NNK25361.1 TRAP transporter substrate-binding protein DctP [Woeseiaceae bacterium]
MNRLTLGIALLVLSLPLQAATLKIATVTPEGSQWMEQMRASAREIKERTEGRVQIKYYGGGVMGSDQKVLSRIRIGALQGGAFTPSALASQYPDLNLYGLPMVFDSEEEAAYVRERMDATLQAGLEDAGWVNFGFAAGGFAILMSNKPVRSLDDLKGKKVWIPEGDTVSRYSMEALSLSPVTLPLTDVLTGLQTGLIDIVAMSPIGALVLQWHTKVKYITELPLVYTFGFMAVDKRAFNKLDDADKAIVRDVMEQTYAKLNEVNLVDNRGAREALINAGLQSVAVDMSEYDRVRDVLMESTAELGEEDLYTPDLYTQMLAHIEEFRSRQAAAVEQTF